MPPPAELLAFSSPETCRIPERTWIDPLHAIGICIVAAHAETIGPEYVAAVEPSDVAGRMQIIAAHSRVRDDRV